ncbi:MAG TPA: class I SAM-dependent methyltransferase [Thermoanaerobaculia bacterium]
MKDRDAPGWEELAQREPYFPVLTSSSVATKQFFESGESDIAALLSAIASLLGHEAPVTSALDFGCGAGRLTIPLARRAKSVVACDVSPTILAHVRDNVRAAGLHNVTCIEASALPARNAREFDFICSLLVLQYVRPARGHEIIRTLLRSPAPDGIAAIQLTFERPRAAIRRLAQWTSAQWPFARRRKRNSQMPDVRLNEYQQASVQALVARSGAQTIGIFPTGQPANSAVLVIRKAL